MFCADADDLDLSADFFEYFIGTLPILQSDPSLWCVSAWNDNGKISHVSAESGTVRKSLLHACYAYNNESKTCTAKRANNVLRMESHC